MSLWNTLLKQPLANLLFFLYQATGENLGISIILIGAIVGLAMIPLMLPSLKSAQKMKEIKPELDKLSKKHKNDKQALAMAQMELYKKHQINPGASFFPMVLRIVVVIALYQVLRLVVESQNPVLEVNNLLYSFIKLPENTILNTRFLYLDITKPDIIPGSPIPGIFLLGSALAQYFSTKITSRDQKTKKQKKEVELNQEEMTQRIIMLLMPFITIIVGYKLSSGLVLSWLIFSLVALFQQIYFKKSHAKNSSKK